MEGKNSKPRVTCARRTLLLPSLSADAPRASVSPCLPPSSVIVIIIIISTFVYKVANFCQTF
jgi:hypothetical protein